MNLLIAALICVAAAAAEGLLAGGDVRATLAQIRQPSWALPLFAWIVIGLVYYVACLVVLWRLLNFGLDKTEVMRAFALLITIMAANAAFNWVFFRKRDFRTSLWFYFPYAILVAGLIVQLSRIDTPAAVVFIIYAAYLPYAVAWSFRVWRLNARPSRSE